MLWYIEVIESSVLCNFAPKQKCYNTNFASFELVSGEGNIRAVVMMKAATGYCRVTLSRAMQSTPRGVNFEMNLVKFGPFFC